MAVGINPLQWGWKRVEDKFVPIMTNLEPAPPDILNIIRCKCNNCHKINVDQIVELVESMDSNV